MRTLSEIVGIESITLAEPVEEKILPAGDTRGIKTTPEDQKRVLLPKLERSYMVDPVLFNGINRIVNIIMSTNYKLVGSESSVAFIEEFLENIGNRGGSTDWRALLEIIFKHQCIYGRSFTEIIYNAEATQILDLDYIDPKKMDYALDSNKNIVLDENSNPVGFVETIPYTQMEGDLKTDTPPNKVSIEGNEIYFVPERIAHCKLYTAGDGFYGLGLIEPVYVTSNRKMELEKALANIYIRTAFPTKYAKVGNQFHEATEDLLKRVADQLKNADYRSVMAIPDYVELGLLEPKSSEKLQTNLDYFIDNETTGLGVPKAFAVGSGEATNRATLARQEYLFKLGLHDIIERTTNCIEDQIFARIVQLHDLDDVPQIVWGEIVLEELDSKSKRLVDYVNAGVIQPDENIENLIRKMESLPPREGDRKDEEKTESGSDKKETE